jgi:hypothetical protein
MQSRQESFKAKRSKLHVDSKPKPATQLPARGEKKVGGQVPETDESDVQKQLKLYKLQCESLRELAEKRKVDLDNLRDFATVERRSLEDDLANLKANFEGVTGACNPTNADPISSSQLRTVQKRSLEPQMAQATTGPTGKAMQMYSKKDPEQRKRIESATKSVSIMDGF